MGNDVMRDNATECEIESMGDTGLEHIQKSPEKQTLAPLGGAESGAILPSGVASLPPALTEIIAGWSRLPAAVQAGILAIVRGSCPKPD
jgi:hypothetical protein